MEHVKNYINGKWMDAKSGETFQSINPAHQEEVVGIVSKSGRRRAPGFSWEEGTVKRAIAIF